MAINNEVKIKGCKVLKYKSSHNTWYRLRNLKPLIWAKFDDNYTFNNNNSVTGNEYYIANCGDEIINLKTVIPARVTFSAAIKNGNPNIEATNHGLSVGTMLSIVTTAGGFTAGNIYYVLTVVDANNFTLSATYTSGSTAINGTANVTGSFYKRNALFMNSNAAEGMRSLEFGHGNHVNKNYLIGNINNDITINYFSVVLFGRVNSTGQNYPAGVTRPERTFFMIKSGSNYIKMYLSGTNAYPVFDYNGNTLQVNVITFDTNTSNPFFICARYDGNSISMVLRPLSNNPYDKEVVIGSIPLTFFKADTIVTIGADSNGNNALGKCLVDSIKIYNRFLTDEELLLLYNQMDGNQFCSLTQIYQYFDFYRWQLDDNNSAMPIQQIGYNGIMSPNDGTVNLKTVNIGTGILINQIEDDIKCYKFMSSGKGYLTSNIDIAGNLPVTDGNTIGFWFKDTSVLNSKKRWFSNTTGNATNGANLLGFGENAPIGGNPTLYLTSNNLTQTYQFTSGTWKNKWHFFCMTFNGNTDTISLYMDGVFLMSVADATFNPSAGFFIGGRNATTDGEYVDGFIRDIMFKPYKMLQGEMRIVYNNGTPLEI